MQPRGPRSDVSAPVSPRPTWFSDPNGPAYRADERRVGPPLAYVGEKLRHGLACQHALLHALRGHDGDVPGATGPDGADAPADGARVMAARMAFGYQLTAYLALYNMLGSRGSEDDVDRLAATPPQDFRRWLAFVEREGSVSGA